MKEQDDLKIELYRGADRKFFGKISFLPVVRESLERLLGRSLLLDSIQILILNLPEEPLPMEPPIVENLVPEFGYTYIKVYEGNFLIYQHPHRLYDVVTRTLQKKLSEQYPEENWWGFRVDLSEIPKVSAIRLKLTVLAPHYTSALKEPPEKKPSFTVRRLEEEKPPIKTLGDFGVISSETGSGIQESGDEISSNIHPVLVKLSTESQTQTSKAPVKVVLKRSLYQDICHERPLSRKVEEGGFLIGKVYRDGEDENIYLLEITNALTAQHTGASFLHLTFTGDSFVEVKRTLNQNHPGDRLLGWYHTHLFPATPSFGLSSIDVELHFSTFTIPWQLAGLINVDGNKRTLRFYVRQGNKMVLCPYWVIDERE
ncbi:hypothetical protein G7B40_033310 [Aetokthonos hydrillicola Thurmond2011]|jgi:proteasome lid subunit RPN8/RPN11|uniref:JAB-N domain-containing protein n=1 Tax=Aetokthonos hydrillicola Thurmond2011 TaxID=2712845 RepID=A0AAP5MDC4_9CYAN|nr:JAB N-terminal domain-containing protein [Aetokthonos hydrillicola]MBO3459559.1 hypothetical protein [Aetokthonos hydrillicola CCALA 1050]MBW4590309.1 hypothetical protein [Aetokthonos hydrillicola CCALA 1050]MDR9899403.1 hypothetical protein [Aetokthonos hydrillicola Thurmond2011]